MDLNKKILIADESAGERQIMREALILKLLEVE